jgi:HEXXH motif-containing protein
MPPHDIKTSPMKTTSPNLTEPDNWQELVLPMTGRSADLRTRLQGNLKSSLRKIVREIERVLPQSVDGLADGVERLDLLVRFSPRLYFDYFMLLQSMARSDATAVSAHCDALRATLCGPYAYRFEVREQIDEIARSFLHAHRVATASQANFLSDGANEAIADQCDPVSGCDARQARRHIAEIERALTTSAPDLADELGSLISIVQLMPRSFSGEAASSLSAFGTVLVRPPLNTDESHTRFFYFDRIVHESAHLYLNLLMTFDPLLTNGRTPAVSPARQTLRPLKGVLHAHFVFFRLLHAYRHAPDSIRHTEAPCPPRSEMDRMSLSALPMSFAAREAIYFDKFIEGDSIIRSAAQFTPNGRRFFDSMMETLCHV